jgi:MFS family permease
LQARANSSAVGPPTYARKVSLTGRIGILRPLKIRDFALLWTGLAVSLTGDGIYLIAIAWQVYKISNDPAALGFVGAAWTAPSLILILYSGVLSDRVSRKRLMLGADLLRAVTIATMGFLTISGNVQLWQLVVLAAVYGAGDALFGPANSAIIPQLVPQDLLVQANSLGQFVRPIAETLLGPALGGILVYTAGAGWAFVADSGTFLFSALMIFLMRPTPPVRERTTSTWFDVKEGLGYIRRHTWLWGGMVAATVSLLCAWGPMEVLVPYLVKNELHGSPLDIGLVFAFGGLGAVTAAVFMGQRQLPRKPLSIAYGAWIIGTALLAGFGLVHNLGGMFVVSALVWFCITVLLVIWFTLVQRLVPATILGRVSSLDWLISTAGVPISFALAGPIAAWLGARQTMIWAGLLGAGVIVVFVIFVPGILGPERDRSLESQPEETPTG